MKALWLVSWYPNSQNKWNGDFIQRHAQAVALFCNVHVIHAEPVTKNMQAASETIINPGNPFEVITLFKSRNKLQNNLTYFKTFATQVKKYIRENGLPDIVHVHVPFKAGIVALWIKKMYKIPYVITEHWAIYNTSAPDNYFTRSAAFKFIIQQIFARAAAFYPVSNELGNAVNKLVAKTNFITIPNVVDTAYFNYQPVAERTVFTFIHVSTFKQQKNPVGILNGFAHFNALHPATRLVIVGNSTHEYKNYAAENGLQPGSIIFKGEVSYQTVAIEMQQAQAFVLFSNFENMPCVISEALCCGLPVIATNVGGIQEVINNSNGLLINAGNEAQLTEAMLTVYHNYRTYTRFSIATEAAAKYNYQNIGKQYVQQYNLHAGVTVRNDQE